MGRFPKKPTNISFLTKGVDSIATAKNTKSAKGIAFRQAREMPIKALKEKVNSGDYIEGVHDAVLHSRLRGLKG